MLIETTLFSDARDLVNKADPRIDKFDSHNK